LRTGVENLPVSAEINGFTCVAEEGCADIWSTPAGLGTFGEVLSCCGLLTAEQISMLAIGLLAIIDR
jgi:hypothetical protein